MLTHPKVLRVGDVILGARPLPQSNGKARDVLMVGLSTYFDEKSGSKKTIFGKSA
jgi:hypothetical protein